jgi:uncharacterized protein YjbI with pentapeptide repeats
LNKQDFCMKSIEIGRSWANLRGANLRGADLSGADLSGADLRGASLGKWKLNDKGIAYKE